MAKYNVLGNAMYEDLCKEVDAPFRKVGSYVLAFSDKEKEHLEMLYQRGLNNGVPEMEIIDAAEIQKREPHVSKEAVAALWAFVSITSPDFNSILNILFSFFIFVTSEFNFNSTPFSIGE